MSRRLFLLALVLPCLLAAAPADMPAPPDDPTAEQPPFTLPTDERYASHLEVARERIKRKDFVVAVTLLQRLLDLERDAFITLRRQREDRKEGKVIVSLKAEAERMIAALPANGRAAYQQEYGDRAADLVRQARLFNDLDILADVVRRYLYTEAGLEAVERLATRLLDRDSPSAAAEYFERLIDRAGIDQLSGPTLFRAALAFRRVADAQHYERTWKALATKVGKEGLKLGDRTLTLDDLQKEIERRRVVAVTPRHGWPTFRGDSTRNAVAAGGLPILDPVWKVELSEDRTVRDWLKKGRDALAQVERPVLPDFHPITLSVGRDAGGFASVIYRDHGGIRARSLVRSPEEELKVGEVYWEAPSQGSLDRMVKEPRHIGHLNQAMTGYVNARMRPGIIFENGVWGSLSTDGKQLYAVEDLQVPLPPAQAPPPRAPGGLLAETAVHNRLQGYDADSGKLLWEIGDAKDKGELSNSFFLSVPLVLKDKLLVLNAKANEVRLLHIDPPTGNLLERPRPLVKLREPLTRGINYRLDPAHIALAEGILVCPTNAGVVLGVDFRTGQTLWALGYEQRKPDPPAAPKGIFGPKPEDLGPSHRMRYSAPMIHRGRVVLAPPDGDAIHCVSLRDGSLAWKLTTRADDLYVAGIIGDHVLIVGAKTCRAVSLDDGKEVWTLETGTPSGLGVPMDRVYLLPLARAAATREPELCVIDPAKGRVITHIRSRKKEVLGNLLLVEGFLMSQSDTTLAAYPLLENELKTIGKLLLKDPKDPVALARRGDLKLDKGDLAGAVEDYRDALAGKPPAELRNRVRERLYEALLELFQRDYPAAKAYLKLFEDLSKDAGAAVEERNRRTVEFLLLAARGLEKEGQRVEAARRYMELSEHRQQPLVRVPEEPGLLVAPSVWARRRLDAIMKAATPAERKEIEKELAERLKKARSQRDPAGLQRLVAVLGVDSALGREARFTLAAHHQDEGKFLPSEHLLFELRRQKHHRGDAARALEKLAEMWTRQGLLTDAVGVYRDLGQDFADVVVRDGKTGKELYDALLSDKRFLPYLPEGRPDWFKLTYRAAEEKGNYPTQFPALHLERQGDDLTYFDRHLVGVRLDFNQLRMVNRDTGEDAWSQALPNIYLQSLVLSLASTPAPRFRYHNLGHLVILPLGHRVFAVDPVGKHLLWESNLWGEEGTPVLRSHHYNPADGSLRLSYADGWTQRMGLRGLVTPNVVVLDTRQGLVGVRPLDGEVLWKYSAVGNQHDLFHDGEHLFVVELDAKGQPQATHVLSMRDGSRVPAADFSALARKRIKTWGGTMLIAERTKEEVTLRQHDVLAGRDVWKKSVPAGSLVLDTEDETLAGLVQPDGKVSVFDLDAGKEVLNATMKPEHMKNAESVFLARDPTGFYLACRQPHDQRFDWAMPNVATEMGLRAALVNGFLYRFAKDGSVAWFAHVPDSALVLNRFRELPVMILSARVQKRPAAARAPAIQIETRVFEKRNGKLLFEATDDRNQQAAIHTLRLDEKTGIVEVISPSTRLRLEPRQK